MIYISGIKPEVMTSNGQFELTLDHLMRTIDLPGRTNRLMAFENELLRIENKRLREGLGLPPVRPGIILFDQN